MNIERATISVFFSRLRGKFKNLLQVFIQSQGTNVIIVTKRPLTTKTLFSRQ